MEDLYICPYADDERCVAGVLNGVGCSHLHPHMEEQGCQTNAEHCYRLDLYITCIPLTIFIERMKVKETKTLREMNIEIKAATIQYYKGD